MRFTGSVISRGHKRLCIKFQYFSIFHFSVKVIGDRVSFFLNVKLSNQNTTYKKFQCHILGSSNDRFILKLER